MLPTFIWSNLGDSWCHELQNHFLQTCATGMVNNEACQQSTARWGCNLRAASTLVFAINLKLTS